MTHPIHPFRLDSFRDAGQYRSWAEANPSCVCTYDDYDGCLRMKADCLMHGEKCKKHPACNCWRCRPNELTRERVKRVNLTGEKDTTKVTSYDPPPPHYATKAGFDVWAIWDAFDLDRYTAGAIKYLLRAGKKDIAPRLDDLVKARNYIEKAIEFEKSKNHKD